MTDTSMEGTTSVLLGATNATGTGHATLVITVAATGVTPTITNSPLTAAGTVGIGLFPAWFLRLAQQSAFGG